MNRSQVNAIVQEWNVRVPVGSTCTLINDFGDRFETKTRSEAWASDADVPLVKVDGLAGSYMLSRVVPHVASSPMGRNEGGERGE